MVPICLYILGSRSAVTHQQNCRLTPFSAMPLSFVVQVSPAFTGRARVSVPVDMISPAAIESGPSSTFDFELLKRAQPFLGTWADVVARSDQQCAMHGIGGNAVGCGKFPAREDRLHDLIAVRDPCDALKQRGIVHAGRGRGSEPEHDFRLDLGFGVGRKRER